MAFVDAESFVGPLRTRMLPFVLAQRHVDSVERIVLILTCVVDPGGNPVLASSVSQLDLNLEARELGNV